MHTGGYDTWMWSNVCWIREHSLLGEASLYGWSPVLQGCIRLLHKIQIKSYFLHWSVPVLLNWRPAIQWSFPQRWVFSVWIQVCGNPFLYVLCMFVCCRYTCLCNVLFCCVSTYRHFCGARSQHRRKFVLLNLRLAHSNLLREREKKIYWE